MRLYHAGDRGEPVRDIQGRLAALGFDASADPRGFYGPATEAAVRCFQEGRGLPRDGIVGPDTWRALVDASYRLGDRLLYRRVPALRGDDVAELQRSLNALGFECGKVDGIFGAGTMGAVLDFQDNRGMVVDGIVGIEMVEELRLMDRETTKPGRDSVRERQWLASLPDTIAGQRIYIDAFCGDEEEAARSWEAAIAAAQTIQNLGGSPLLSRSVDTAPPEQLRAARANSLDIDIVLGFQRPQDGEDAVYFFASDRSRSAAGETLATTLAAALGIEPRGVSIPMVKETRSPAVVVAVADLDAATGRIAAEALASAYSDQPRN